MNLVLPRGVKLQKETATPGTYADVAQLTDTLTMPKPVPETAEARTFDAAGAGVPHKSTGWVEGGSASGSLLFHPTDHAELIALTVSTDPTNWRILYPGGQKFDFTGASFSMEVTAELSANSLKASFEIKLDGIWTYAAT